MNDLYILQHDPEPLRRYQAAVNLAFATQIPHDIAAVLSHLMRNDPDWAIRQQVAWAAGQCRLEDCIPALIQILTGNIVNPNNNMECHNTDEKVTVAFEEDEQVRYVAALALIYMNHTYADEQLDRLEEHPHEPIRRAVRSAQRARQYITDSA